MNEHALWDFNKTTDVGKLLQTLMKEKQEKTDFNNATNEIWKKWKRLEHGLNKLHK